MKIVSLSRDQKHRFSKNICESIEFVAGRGVKGDAHYGETVKHRSRVKIDSTQPNLRQVHLIHSELLTELRDQGFNVDPGVLGENVLTMGLDLLALPQNTLIELGPEVVLKLTGLRNPCAQLDRYQTGLTKAVLGKDKDGNLIRKAGVMAVVEKGGIAKKGDALAVKLPPQPHEDLQCV